jgi:hypothetical protein
LQFITTALSVIFPGMETRRYIAYFRVSTDRQGRSGLGLEAQQQAVMVFLHGRGSSSTPSPRSRAGAKTAVPNSPPPSMHIESTRRRCSSPSSIGWRATCFLSAA